MIIIKKHCAPPNCIKPDLAESLAAIIALIKEFAATQECCDVSLTLHWDSGHPKANESTRQQQVPRASEAP
jgi:hypothetical protein